MRVFLYPFPPSADMQKGWGPGVYGNLLEIRGSCLQQDSGSYKRYRDDCLWLPKFVSLGKKSGYLRVLQLIQEAMEQHRNQMENYKTACECRFMEALVTISREALSSWTVRPTHGIPSSYHRVHELLNYLNEITTGRYPVQGSRRNFPVILIIWTGCSKRISEKLFSSASTRYGYTAPWNCSQPHPWRYPLWDTGWDSGTTGIFARCLKNIRGISTGAVWDYGGDAAVCGEEERDSRRSLIRWYPAVFYSGKHYGFCRLHCTCI